MTRFNPFASSAESLVLSGEHNPSKIAQAVAKGRPITTDTNIIHYGKLRGFKKTLKASPEGARAYQSMKSSGALAELKGILKLDEGVLGEFRRYKREVKKGVIESIDSFKQSQATLHNLLEKTERECSKKREEANELAKELIGEVRGQLDASLGSYIDAVSRQAEDLSIVCDVQAAEMSVTFLVEGEPHTVCSGTLHKCHDFLSAIANTSMRGDRDDNDAIQLNSMPADAFRMLIDCRRGVMPADEELLRAKEVGDTYRCEPLIDYCEQQLNRQQFTDAQRQLKNMLALNQALPSKPPSRFSYYDLPNQERIEQNLSIAKDVKFLVEQLRGLTGLKRASNAYEEAFTAKFFQHLESVSAAINEYVSEVDRVMRLRATDDYVESDVDLLNSADNTLRHKVWQSPMFVWDGSLKLDAGYVNGLLALE